MKALVLTLLFLLIAPSKARILSRCKLLSLLEQYNLEGYMGYRLGNWVCLAQNASNYNTQAVSGPNKDGSRNYGIFQINSRWWCDNNQGPTANGCKKPCSAFTDDDIKDDIACAKKIVRGSDNISARWPWSNNCTGPNMRKWTRGCKL